ncbi:MAG: adenylate/guanylate cyclase domain-containing protein, partial [SAR324 cluster bacterium]|nr:adenylate/guanylate cyclase domain-containing protein [SAR324 cluster bacterium]
MEPQTERKLAAILMADVVGYSRLMSGDEAATVRTLKACREVFASVVERHRGRVVNAPGDSVLAEFGSVVEGVAAAVAIQQRLAEDNRRLPEDRRMHFRIGINLGDVVVEEGAIYGDGVNVAARLEALAEPGGIWVSRNAFDQVDGKLPVAFEYMGEHSVKNIDKPLRAYRVDWETGSAPADRAAGRPSAVVEAPALPLPEQPSIAVLPFENMSG